MPVGVAIGGRGAPWCRPSAGRRSLFDPCMPGWLGVSRLACGQLLVGSWLLQQCGRGMVVLAAFRSPFSLLGLARCSWFWRVRRLSMWLFRPVWGVVVVVLSDVMVCVM